MTVAATSLLALVAAGSGAATASKAPVGTWRGPLGYAHERSYSVPALVLVVSAATAQASFSGLSQAAHDAPDATSTCSVGFRFTEANGRWHYYQQSGRPRSSNAGQPEGAPCSASGRKAPGQATYVMRLLGPTHGKLKVEVTEIFRVMKAEPFVAKWRGYLTR